MSKSIKFFPVLLIIFSLILSFYSVIYASNINMNLTSNNSVSENISDTPDNTIIDENVVDEPVEDNQLASEVASPSSITATAEEGLGLSNILNIILIAVGIVLILLAVAIIIRIK